MIAKLLILICLAAAADAGSDPPVDPSASPGAGTGPAESAPAVTTGGDPYEGAVGVFHFTFEGDDDRDFDRQPDGWIRRKGPDFPAYVEEAIDRDRGHGGKGQSLCFKANGGRVILYSKPIVIDPYHSYIFRGFIRTQLLQNDAALISVSLLNHKRQRVQRFLTRPVTGTFKDWCEVTVGPIVPHDDVHFVVVGCHLVPGSSRMDIHGSVWFDDLWMGALPLFSLENNFQSHFREHDAGVVITSQVDGLDRGHAYRLDLKMVDAEARLVASTSFDLTRKASDAESSATTRSGDEPPKKEKPIFWNLDPQPHGFYAVEAVLSRDGKPAMSKRTSFAVMDPLSETSEPGEFGWTIKRASDMTALKQLAEIASQAGINWLKYPLWGSASEGNLHAPPQISAFFDDLLQRRITPVGLLNDPPADLRAQFAPEWTGVGEIFTMRTEFWRESIEKVIARFSSHVRYWQLGQENDESFAAMSNKNLSDTIGRVKSEFDRIGRDTRVGIHWNWETPPPRRNDVRGIFLSMSSRQRLKENELATRLKAAKADAPERWVLLKPLPKSGSSAEERGSDLVKKMVEAKIGGADKIFIDDVFDEETGILHPGGAPSLLFLPWRTTALALEGADFIGSFLLPEGSRNYAFARKDEVAVVVWNNERVDEDLFLGEDSIVTDVLGRRLPLSPSAAGERPKLRVGPSPLVVRRFPEPVARWMAAVSFSKGRLPSKTGKQRESICGMNTFRQAVNGQLRIVVPKDWRVDPQEIRYSLAPGEKFEWPITLELPSNTSLGTQRLVLDFAMSPYTFRVYRDYEIGLGDVVLSIADARLENGDLEIKQFIDNNTKPEERLTFECNLYVPNRRRMQRMVTKLSHGRDVQRYILPDADSLIGQELHLRAQQIGGQRVLNLRWKVGENWDVKKGPQADSERATPGLGAPAERPSGTERPGLRRKLPGIPSESS